LIIIANFIYLHNPILLRAGKEKEKKRKKDRFLHLGIVDRQNQNGAGKPTPPLSNSTLTTQDKKAYAVAQHRFSSPAIFSVKKNCATH
jgi:hypothetical protein